MNSISLTLEVGVARCPNNHDGPDDQPFCGQCGETLVDARPPTTRLTGPEPQAPPATKASVPLRLSGPPASTASWLARVKPRSFAQAAAITLVPSLAMSIVFAFLYTPRFFVWTAFTLFAIAGAASLRTLTTRTVAAFYLIGPAAFIIDWAVGLVADPIRNLPVLPFNAFRFFSYLGAISLALLVVAYFDPTRRAQLREILAPNNTLEPLRTVVVLAVVLLGFVPIARSFTGPFTFGLVRSWPAGDTPGVHADYRDPEALADSYAVHLEEQNTLGVDTVLCVHQTAGLFICNVTWDDGHQGSADLTVADDGRSWVSTAH